MLTREPIREIGRDPLVLLAHPFRTLRWLLEGLHRGYTRAECLERGREAWEAKYGWWKEPAWWGLGWRSYTFFIDWSNAYPHVTVDRVTGEVLEIGYGRVGSANIPGRTLR